MSPLIKYVARKQLSRPLITLLTIGSLAATAFAAAAAGSTLIGLRRTFASTGSPSRVLVLAKEAESLGSSVLPLDQFQQVAANPEVKQAYPEQLFSVWVLYGDGKDGGEIVEGRGLEDGGYDLYGAKLTSGRWPAKGQREVVIGSILAARYANLQLGVRIYVREARASFPVVGVFHSGSSHDGEIFTSRAGILNETREEHDPSIALLDTASPEAASALIDRISSSGTLKTQVRAVRESDYYQGLVSKFQPIIISIFIVLLLVFFGCALAATGALSVVFGQRVGDIAVLRALGFKNRAVIGLAIGEAEMLALISAAVGLAAAFAGLHGYAAYIASVGYSVVFRMLITPGVVLAAVGILMVIGFIAASFPLIRVMRLEIKDALRE